MSLLFDQNLSRRLPALLLREFPGARHTSFFGLESASDFDVWNRAESERMTIVTKDFDFQALALTRSAPPKVIIVALGNCSTSDVVELLKRYRMAIERFERSSETLLILGGRG